MARHILNINTKFNCWGLCTPGTEVHNLKIPVTSTQSAY